MRRLTLFRIPAATGTQIALYPTAKNQTLKQMVADGRVRVSGKRATKLSQRVAEGEDVRVDERPAPVPKARASLAPLRLVHEDDDVLVIDKPPGLLTSTGPREKRPTALAIVRRYVEATSPKARVGLIHRLDRDASGLLVFSKSDVAYQSLKTQFFKHTVDRGIAAMLVVDVDRSQNLQVPVAQPGGHDEFSCGGIGPATRCWLDRVAGWGKEHSHLRKLARGQRGCWFRDAWINSVSVCPSR